MMPRKRHYDLREFWLWYERSWPTRGWHATPPPFSLTDISQNDTMTPAERRLWRAISVVFALLFLGLIVGGLFLVP